MLASPVDKVILTTSGGGTSMSMSIAGKQVNMQDKYYADFFLPSDLFSFIMKESFCAGLSLAREQQQKIHYLIFAF